MSEPKLAEHLALLGSLQERIKRFSRHIDLCTKCSNLATPMCKTGERLKEEMSK